MINRLQIEKREREFLAPYACRSAESRGRVYPQEQHDLRTVFQRDRDRIIHCNAFRRMEFKTQVFVPHEGDHFRTRMTHTIEVAQISRTLARNLRLNEDLSEAIALVHDLGHTPFGHSGEDVLDELLKDSGGFNHNAQSLRIVDLLEQEYRSHPGLNLSYEVREGIVKHETKRATEHPDFDPSERPTLEAALVDNADELAYNAHDIDDGLRSGLLELSDLKELAIFQMAEDYNADQRRHRLVRHLLNLTVTDLIKETSRRIAQNKIVDVDSLRNCKEKICGYSEELAGQIIQLKQFLRRKLYKHSTLLENADRARIIIECLFDRFKGKPELLPERYREMLESEDLEIVVADYVAGMTDRYAEQMFKKGR